MIIMSQDHKRIIDCTLVEMQRNIGGGKAAKYILIANTGGLSSVVLGSFAEEKNAMDELDKIYTAFSNGEKCYTVR